MPLVRMITSVGCSDLPSQPGEEVQLSPERAKQVVAAGWGEIVRDHKPETPEGRTARPETTDVRVTDSGAEQTSRRQVRRKTSAD